MTENRAHNDLDYTIELSHRQTFKREKIFGRLNSRRQPQRFLSAHDLINLTFRSRRCQLSTASHSNSHSDTFSLWVNYVAEMAGPARLNKFLRSGRNGSTIASGDTLYPLTLVFKEHRRAMALDVSKLGLAANLLTLQGLYTVLSTNLTTNWIMKCRDQY